MSAQTSTTTSGASKAIVSRVAKNCFDVGVDDITSKDVLLSRLLGEVHQLGRISMAVPDDTSNEIRDKEEVEEAAANVEGPEVVSASS